MLCHNCQTENPPNAKFCNECGQKLIAKCSTCGQGNPPGAKFCNECGEPLGQPLSPKPRAAPVPQPPPPPNALQSLLPQDFAAKLHHARETRAMAGERRIVTMLFCDVQGSTAAAGQLDPEDWAQIMNGVFEQMIRPVYKYEGTVARLMGDAILAFFGAPVAHEDDPQRAILAGMEIMDGFAPYRAQIEKDWGLEINVRVGINTGLVMVGAVGSDLQMEYTALGDAINLAARMEQTAAPGTLQVSEDTYKLVAPVFEWEALGTVTIKGKDDPVRTFRPLQPKSQPGRLRGIEGLDAPMVGRAAELDQLHAAIQRLAQGVGSLIFITGEAGLGKSRLIRELYHYQSPVTDHHLSISFHETASFSYETAQPYSLFQRLLRRVCGVEEGDSPAEMWGKFIPILDLIPADVPDQGGVFEALFAFQGTTKPVPDGESFKRQLFALMERIWRSWAETAPRVLIFDDLHWSDPASVELLTHLFSLTDTCPVAIVCATRPDRESPGWTAKESASKEFPHRFLEINIHPLTAKDTNQLVDKLLTISELPSKLRQRILEKTDGNPFFIEEVVRTLIENGLVAWELNGEGIRWRAVKNIEDIEIPGNLQALLIARIDKLEDSARRTLQLASVIGRSFYFRVLEAINQTIEVVQDELDRQLTTLQRADLIREAARVPELEYIFRHSLTQEAAYSTILLRQRREFHRQVGEAIENLFPARVEEFAPVLGHHFGEAHDPRAVHYEILAGDGAFRLFAIPEAIGHYTRAVSHLQYQKQEVINEQGVLNLYLRLGRCYELQNELEKVVATYQKLTELSWEHKNPQMELAALQAMGVFLAIPTSARDPDRAQVLADRAYELARQLGDRKAEAKINWMFMLVRMYSGHMADAIPYGEKSAEIARRYNMQEELTFALQDLSLAYMGAGKLQKAHETLLEAAELWKLSGNFPMLAENRANMVFERTLSGYFEEAQKLTEESIQLSEKIANLWGQGNGRVFGGLVPFAQGNVDQALETFNIGIAIMEKVGHPGGILAWVQKAWLLETLGEYDQALATAEEAVKISTSFLPFFPIALGLLAKIKLRYGNAEEAEKLLIQANQYPLDTLLIIDVIVKLGMIEFSFSQNETEKVDEQIRILDQILSNSKAIYFFPSLGELKARAFLAKGQADRAISSLEEACQYAEDMGAINFLWPLQKDLARLKQTSGFLDEVRFINDSARKNIHQIAKSISDNNLRARYLMWAENQILKE